MSIIVNIQRFHLGPRVSEVVVHGGTVYLAGQVAHDLDADVAGQTAQVLATIDRLLAEVGSDRKHILTMLIHLASIGDFEAMQEVYSAWVPKGHTPARTTVEARLAHPSFKVEITVVAAL